MFFLIIICQQFLAACNQNTTYCNNRTKSSCIAPIVDFAYPVNGFSESIQQNDVLPPDPWNEITDIPEIISRETGTYQEYKIQFSRNGNDGIEIWMINLRDNGGGQERSVLVYNEKRNNWTNIKSEIGGAPVIALDLYLGSDNSIWINAYQTINYYKVDLLTNNEYSKRIIGKFNEESKEFDMVEFGFDIPAGGLNFHNDMFWILQIDRSFYSIDPVHKVIAAYKTPPFREKDIEEMFILPEKYVYRDNSLVFMTDGTIYFLNETSRDFTTPFYIELFHFIPDDNMIRTTPYIRLNNGGPFFHLFVDKDENLWVSDQGWMDIEMNWYEIVRSPVFITTREIGMSILWERPEIVLQSSDGKMWYESINGMVTLDPKTGEWCWFTTYRSNIVEDNGHHLWMVADNKLFKRPVE